MAYNRNPTWKDWPVRDTPITAVELENIEEGLVDAAAVADLANEQSLAAQDTAAQAVAVAQAASTQVGTPSDSGVASIVDSGTETRAALDRSLYGANVPRTLAKLRAGKNITVGVIGDSKSDPTTPGNVGGGPAERWASLMQSRFGVTVTVVNGAKSGHTAARQFLEGYISTVISAVPDLVIIHLGTNDSNSDASGPYAAGYVRDASLAATERAVAYIRDVNESAEVVLIGTSPYAGTLTSSANLKIREYATGLVELAATLGAEYIDVFAAFAAVGDFSGLMYDSTHQNSAGNDLYASTMAAHFPVTSPTRPATLAPRSTIGRYGINGVSKASGTYGYAIAAAPVASGPLTYALTGTGWTVDTTFDVSSTPGDTLTLTARALEFHVNIDLSATYSPVVDFYLDGNLVAANVDLHAQSSKNSTSYWLAPFTGLSAATHAVKIVVKSGTLRVQSSAALIATAVAVVGYPDLVRSVSVAGTVSTTTLTASYQNLVPITSIPLPDGWTAMDVQLTGRASFRVSGSTTAARRIDVAIRESGTSLQGTRQVGVPVTATTFNLPDVNLVAVKRGLTAAASIDVIAKLDVVDNVQALSWYLDAILIRSA